MHSYSHTKARVGVNTFAPEIQSNDTDLYIISNIMLAAATGNRVGNRIL